MGLKVKTSNKKENHNEINLNNDSGLLISTLNHLSNSIDSLNKKIDMWVEKIHNLEVKLANTQFTLESLIKKKG